MLIGGLVPVWIPRGLRGWTQFGLWWALAVPLALSFASHLQSNQLDPDFATWVFLFCVATLAWLIGGIWWMTVNSEIIPIVELRRSRQDRRRKRRQGSAR